MGLQDRDWYREEMRAKKQQNQNSHLFGSNNHNGKPFNKTVILYLSLSINIILGAALYYITH